MAAKEPVPARSSTSRTRPPLPPPRAASLCATPSLRGSRARGHAPDTPPPGHTTPPSPRASEAASPGKARARECGRTRRAFGALGTSLLQGSRGARRPHPRSHRATAAGRWRAGSLRPPLSCSFCPTFQRLARLSSARRGSTPELPFRNAMVTSCFLSVPPSVLRHTAFPLGH